jgi:hypothetical protein
MIKLFKSKQKQKFNLTELCREIPNWVFYMEIKCNKWLIKMYQNKIE